MAAGERRTGAPVPLILVAALAARLPGLGTRPLWYDEAFAVLFSAQGPAKMLYGTLNVEGGVAADVHPILYYTLLWLWGEIFGRDPWIVRILSVILGVAVVGVGYLLARRLFGRRVGFAAGLILALSPFQLHYAQEVRMYALLALVLTLATLVHWRAMREGGRWRWVLFAVLAAIGMYTHVLASTYLLALALIPILRRDWRSAIWTGLSGLSALLLFLPWLLRIPAQLARVDQFYWVETPGAADLVRTLLIFVGGLPVPEWALPILLFCSILILVLGLWATFQGRSGAGGTEHHERWMLYLAVAPPAIMFAMSFWTPVYLPRALLPSGVAFAIWLGWVMVGSRLPPLMIWTARVGLALGIGIGLLGFFTYHGFPYAPYEAITAEIRAQMEAGDVILHSNKLTAIPSEYYAPELDHRYVADPPGSGSDTLALATQEVLGLIADPDAASAVGEADRVFFLMFGREVQEYEQLGEPRHPHLGWLEDEFKLVGLQEWGDLELYEFSR